jgi:hypothetical protein
MDWKIKALHALGLSQKLGQEQIDRAIEALVSDSLLYRRGVAFLLREPLAEIITEALSDGERKGLRTRIANANRIPLAPDSDEIPKVIWDLIQSAESGNHVVSASCGSTKLYWSEPEPIVQRIPPEKNRTAYSQVHPVTLEQLEGHLAKIQVNDVAPPSWLVNQTRQAWGRKLGIL